MQENSITCVNGTFVPASAASVSVADRGFRFGDGVFETIRLERGVPYHWQFHLTRLNAGLAALRMPHPSIDWADYARRLIQQNKATDGFLRIAISRGVGSVGYMPVADIAPTWIMEYLPSPPAKTTPAILWLSSCPRIPLDCLPVNHKLAQGISNTLALLEAQDNAADEALHLTINGMICEAASANIFWIKGDSIYTPSLEHGCVDGSTRDVLCGLSPIEQVSAPLAVLEHADAVFLTNCRHGIRPVSKLLPSGWMYDPYHPRIAQSQQLLQEARARYALLHEPKWNVA